MPYERLTQPEPGGHPPEVERLLRRQRFQRAFGLWLPFRYPNEHSTATTPSSVVGVMWAALGLACIAAGAAIVGATPTAGWLLVVLGAIGCVGGVDLWWSLRTGHRPEDER